MENHSSTTRAALTPRQPQLVDLIEHRLYDSLPAVQRDFAEELGIRHGGTATPAPPSARWNSADSATPV